MARLTFRHGLVRYQTDTASTPTFLQTSGGGQWIDINVSPDPTVFTIAHYAQDYLFVESVSVPQAWGPFSTGTDYWLYWDIDFITGELTRNYTNLQPVYQATPPPTAVDQHWFDLSEKVMKVWSGSSWGEKLRVFAGFYQNGSVLTPNTIGSQIGISNVTAFAGFPLMDDDDKPVQKFRRNRKGEFVHTETPLASQWARVANFRVESAIVQGEAIENIPIHYAVSYRGPNKIGLAKQMEYDFPAIGIAAEDMFTSEVRSFVTKGYVQDSLWNWTQPAGTLLFVGPSGELTDVVPQQWSIQQIATVVDNKTIFVDTQEIIIYG